MSSSFYVIKFNLYSKACGIETQGKFVITGGHHRPGQELKTVTRYSRTGESDTLPQLKVGRSGHACGSYLNDKGDEVRFILNTYHYHSIRVIVIKVLLVTGGGGNHQRLDSTEVLKEMAAAWRLTASLPSARWGLRSASVENSIFLFGENQLTN